MTGGDLNVFLVNSRSDIHASSGASLDGASRPEEQTRGTVWQALLKLLRAVYLIVGLGAIFAFSYLIGHGMLEGTLGGNDTPWALSLVLWLNRWFPQLPIWYPLQGGGTPLLTYYPTGTHLLAVILHRLTGLTEIQAFRLVGFLSVPLTASGVYLLVWVKLKNQTMALLGGLFYLLSAAAWTWLYYIGIYAQAVSLMYLAPTFLLFDIYISRVLATGRNPDRFRDRLVLPLASMLFCLMLLSHMATALSFSMAIILYALVLPGVASRPSSVWRAMWASTIRALKGIAAGLGLAAFWIIPFLKAQALINREGLSEFAAHQTPYTDLGALLGLRDPPPNFGIWHVQFAVAVAALAALGLVFAIRRRNAVAAWGIVAVSMAIYTAMPGLLPGVVAMFDRLWAYSHVRAISVTMILLPAIAGYGTGALAKLIFDLPLAVIARILKSAKASLLARTPIRLLRSGFVTVAALAIAAASVLYVRLSPHRCGVPQLVGPPNGEAFWPFCFSEDSIILAHRPKFELSGVGPDYHRDVILSLIPELGLDATTRMDTSAFLGTLTQSLSLYTDASIIGIYNYQSSMIHAMWGFMQGVFYGQGYGTPHEMDQLARWFGIEYVALNRDYDPLQKYDEANWPIVYAPEGPSNGGIEVRQFPDRTGLASLLTQPAILAIGGFENGSYDQVFRLFIAGAGGYEEFLIVEGSHKVDDYSLEVLKHFDAVLLHGYGYNNRDRAWELLNQYVADGGSLYVDTGWQFVTPDWEMAEAASVLPVGNLSWTDFGMTDNFVIGDAAIASNVLADEFAPLIWDTKPWGVSFPSGGLRDWSHSVLTVEGKPLIVAGEYGQGRVVWSGMNLIGHALTYENAEERELLRRLLAWLAPAPMDAELRAPMIQRDHPDHIRFLLEGPVREGVSLLWREAFSPDWHAKVEIDGQEVKVPIYRAGPGMMLLRLPPIEATEAVVRMDYSLGLRGWLGLGLTSLTAAGLIAGVVSTDLSSTLRDQLRRSSKRPQPQASVEWMPGLPIVQGDNARQNSSRVEVSRETQAVLEGGDHASASVAAIGIDTGEAIDVETLWARLEESGNLPPSRNDEAQQLINWWRQARSKDPESSSTPDQSKPQQG